MVFPLLPLYAQRYGASPVQLGFLAASFSFTQFFAAPIVGRLSDRFGRKPILFIALLGTAVSFIIFGAASSLKWLFFSRALHGIFSAGVYPIAVAYVGDSTSKEQRIVYVSRLTAIFSLGFIVGPAVAGFLSGISHSLPFFVAGGLALLNAIFILFFVPESLKEKAERFVIREGLLNIKAMAHAFRGNFGTLFFLLFAWGFALSNLQVAFPLFASEQFSFDEIHIGLLFTSMGVTAALTQWIFLPRMARKMGELTTVALGVFIMALGQGLISFAPFPAILFLFVSISTLGSALYRPTINALLSEQTKEGQGTTMGLAFSFESLGRVVGPLSAGVLISVAGLHSQFLLAASVLFLGLFFFIRTMKPFVPRRSVENVLS